MCKAQNFFSDQGVVYRVTAEDGVTRKTYLAKATRTKNSSAVIVTFKVNDEEWNINGSNITYTYPAETEEGVLTPVIQLASGATVNPESGVEQNFFAPEGVTYTVTSENGTVTETYTAKATRTKYGDANITGFSVGGVAWSINGNEITYSYPAGIEAGNLTPDITLSPGATVSPESATSHNFFTDEGVTYTVTSEDSLTTNIYVAKATRPKFTGAEIFSFTVNGTVWRIDGENITYTYPEEMVSYSWTPEIVLSQGAAIDPASTASQNFFADEGVTYTVTSEDGATVKTYIAKAKIKGVELLDRTKMSGHPVGNDTEQSGAGADKLFDGMSRGLGWSGTLQSASFGLYNEGGMPLYYTIDLGVKAVLSIFWIEPRGHNTYGRYAFGNSGGASPYDWNLWGTTYDFADPTTDYYKPANDPYWTEGQWKNDPKWINLGNYKYKRPSDPNATPENPGERSGDAWNRDLEMAYAPPSMTNPMNFNVEEAPPVQYIRWEFIQSWSDAQFAWMQEAWFWGTIEE